MKMVVNAVIEELTEYGLVGVSDDTFEVTFMLKLTSMGEPISFNGFKEFISVLKSAGQYESFLEETKMRIEDVQERMYKYYEDPANNFEFAELDDNEDEDYIDDCVLNYSESSDSVSVTIEVLTLTGLDSILDYWNELIAEVSE